MTEQKTKKKRGRPFYNPDDLRIHIAARVTPKTRTKLFALANELDVSLGKLLDIILDKVKKS